MPKDCWHFLPIHYTCGIKSFSTTVDLVLQVLFHSRLLVSLDPSLFLLGTTEWEIFLGFSFIYLGMLVYFPISMVLTDLLIYVRTIML